jgi:sarcosine oxidase, subunit gamma
MGASMLEATHASPLSHRTTPDATYVDIREIDQRGMIDVRGLTSDRSFMSTMRNALGVDLPKSPRTTASWGDTSVMWLSTDQWLVTCPRQKADTLCAKLQIAVAGRHALVVDVSDMRAVIRLEGDRCREVVMKGASLDLTHGDYTKGVVRRMRFAEIAALLHIVENDVIDIYVFRSYAAYAFEFLLKAARKGSEVAIFDKPAR